MYMISLVIQGQLVEYDALTKAMKGLGAWSNRMGNTWIVHSTLRATEIRDRLKPYIKPTDRLFVAQISRNWAATGMGPGFPEWMQRRAFDTSTPDGTPQGGKP
jgi:hypothetical protein